MPRLEVRLTDDQMERLRRDANAASMDVSNWVRFCCLRVEPAALAGPGAGTGVAQSAERRGPSEGAGSSPAADESPPGPASAAPAAKLHPAEQAKEDRRAERLEKYRQEGACLTCGSLGHETEEHGKW